VRNFHIDSTPDSSRLQLARLFATCKNDAMTGRCRVRFATLAEPAPYCYPPLDFARSDLLLTTDDFRAQVRIDDRSQILLEPRDSNAQVAPKYAAMPMIVLNDVFDVGAQTAWDVVPRKPRPWRLGRFVITTNVTRISWANKPFFNSIFEWKSSAAEVPIVGSRRKP
jgi:hypothetical protein